MTAESNALRCPPSLAYEHIRFNVIVHEAHLSLQGNASTDNSPRRFYFQVLILNRVLHTSDLKAVHDLNWTNEVVSVQLNRQMPLYVSFELFERRRGLSSDECVGKCRVHLTTSSSSLEWHFLRSPAKATIAFLSPFVEGHLSHKLLISVHVDDDRENALRKFCVGYRSAQLTLHIPNDLNLNLLSVNFQRVWSEDDFMIPFISLFQRGSSLFQQLFTFLVEDKGDSEPPSHLDVIPFNELLLEALGNATFVPLNEIRKINGVLLLSTHRIVFIPYRETSKRSGNDGYNGNAPAIELSIANILNCSLKFSDRSAKLLLGVRGDFLFKFKFSRNWSKEPSCLTVLQRMKCEIEWLSFEDNASCLSRTCYVRKNNADSFQRPHVNTLSNDTNMMLKEYTRMGVMSAPHWRLTRLNADFSLCPTYPASLVVPSAAADDLIVQAASQRANRVLFAFTVALCI